MVSERAVVSAARERRSQCAGDSLAERIVEITAVNSPARSTSAAPGSSRRVGARSTAPGPGSGSFPGANTSRAGASAPSTARSRSSTTGRRFVSSNAHADEPAATCSVPSRPSRAGHAFRAIWVPTASGQRATISAMPACGPKRRSSR